MFPPAPPHTVILQGESSLLQNFMLLIELVWGIPGAPQRPKAQFSASSTHPLLWFILTPPPPCSDPTRIHISGKDGTFEAEGKQSTGDSQVRSTGGSLPPAGDRSSLKLRTMASLTLFPL